MSRIAVATVWLLAAHLTADAAEPPMAKKQDWEAIASMLGEPMARIVRNLPEAKEARHIGDADDYTLHIDGRGLDLVFRKDRLAEVHFQLLPGKKIVDVQYSGTLPLGIAAERLESSEEVAARLGQPLEQDERGWKRLTYRHDAYLITLYFSLNRLEAVRVIRRT